MRRLLAVSLISWIALFVAAAAFPAEETAPVYGNWEGRFAGDGLQDHQVRAEIIGLGGGTYRANLFVQSGEDEVKGEMRGKTEKGITRFEGEIVFHDKTYKVEGQANNKGEFTGAFKEGDGEFPFNMVRVLKIPPTLGQKPPEGAIALASGPDTFAAEWNREYHWRMFDNGAFGIAGSSIVSKREFGDAKYHIEFYTPYEPNDRGQGRGNAGFYLQQRYELQVLDSFGLPTANNECGAFYQQAAPRVNASLPPLEWQTYDITFRAPRFDANGNKTANARVTVLHNGIVIHEDFELKHPTPGGIANEAPKGPLLIQDHGDQPRYRNIWILPLD